MSTNRDAVKAYRDAMLLGGANANEIRLRVQTNGNAVPTAFGIAREMEDSELTHVAQVRAAIEMTDAISANGEPQTVDGRIAFYRELDSAVRIFWDGFNGQIVDGVEIVRAA